MQTGKGICALAPDLLELLADDDAPVSRAARLALTPRQLKAARDLQDSLAAGEVCVLRGAAGLGKTTVLRHIAQAQDGTYLSIDAFFTLLRDRSPVAVEETFVELAERALDAATLLVFDDLHLLIEVVGNFNYARQHLMDCALLSLLALAAARGCKLVFACVDEVPASLASRAHSVRLSAATVEDYEAFCRGQLFHTARLLDYRQIYDFAPSLNYHQLRNVCNWLGRRGNVSTDAFLEYLTDHDLSGNVNIEEVEPVDWTELKGLEDLIAELETKVALPFENPELARRLQLKPKRGVLLAGPPGTGKTTIGRALAHRLKGKFFLIDGTVVADSGGFYEQIQNVFAAAKRNAPSVVFIDDADVIFEDGNRSFYRYLLTMMDGIESASAERVCVMLTAMEITSLPPAVLRSGRIELWLRTRLPDEEARVAILRARVASLPLPLSAVDLVPIARAARGLTGADLKASVEDAKLLFARDTVDGTVQPATERYFLKAIAAIHAKRNSYRSGRSHAFAGSAFGFPVP